jgi:hypothetical protein
MEEIIDDDVVLSAAAACLPAAACFCFCFFIIFKSTRGRDRVSAY